MRVKRRNEKISRGFRISNLSILNNFLLGKQCWMFAIEREFLWKLVTLLKYEEEDSMSEGRVQGSV